MQAIRGRLEDVSRRGWILLDDETGARLMLPWEPKEHVVEIRVLGFRPDDIEDFCVRRDINTKVVGDSVNREGVTKNAFDTPRGRLRTEEWYWDFELLVEDNKDPKACDRMYLRIDNVNGELLFGERARE